MTDIHPRLALADQALAKAAYLAAGSLGPADEALAADPLAEEKRPKGRAARGIDHVFLARVPRTPFVFWIGRDASGHFSPVGDFLEICHAQT